jgi:hypothetical protein
MGDPPHGQTYEGRALARPQEELADQGLGFESAPC